MYVGRQNEKSGGKRFLNLLLILLSLWILASALFDRSPFRLFVDGLSYFTGDENKEWETMKDLNKEIERKDSLIKDLETGIEMMKQTYGFRRGVVKVETDYLNMRSEPNLTSDVIMQLPVGSVVEILFYDDQTNRIGGEYGKWCKVKFTGNEGWVWGNYLEIIN